jgi:DNA-binding MarR family transcriptional regulator
MSTTTVNERTKAASQRREQRLLELGAAFRSMFRAFNRVRGRDTHLSGNDLSHAQFQLLLELDERGDLSVGELADAAQLAPATVTQMLDHLAASGHVERVRSDADRRVVVIRLTAQGASRIEAKRAAWKERWRGALEGLDEDQLSAAAEVLARLAQMLEQTPAEAGGTGPQGPSQAPGG